MTKVYLKFQYWYRKYIPSPISNNLTKLINKNLKIQMILFRLKTKIINYRKTGFEHLELLTIEEIVSKVDLKNKSYVDIGAGNGFSSSATYAFAKNSNPNHLYIRFDIQHVLCQLDELICYILYKETSLNKV